MAYPCNLLGPPPPSPPHRTLPTPLPCACTFHWRALLYRTLVESQFSSLADLYTPSDLHSQPHCKVRLEVHATEPVDKMLLIKQDQAKGSFLHHSTVSPRCAFQLLIQTISFGMGHGTSCLGAAFLGTHAHMLPLTRTGTRPCGSTISLQTSKERNSTIERQYYWRVLSEMEQVCLVEGLIMECASA